MPDDTPKVFDPGFSPGDGLKITWAFILPFVIAFAAALSGVGKDFLTSCTTHCDVGAATAGAFAAVLALGTAILSAVKNFLLVQKLKG